MRRFALHAGALLLAGALASAPAAAEPAVPGPALLDEPALIGQALVLADERLALMPQVAAAKWPRQLPVSDPAREQAVVADAAARAAALGLDAQAVAAYFQLQFGFARAVQQRLIDAWTAHAPAAAAPPPDLAGELRPHLDRLTAGTLRALYLVAPFAQGAGFRERALVEAASRLPAARWSEPDRAALVEALARVRATAPASVARVRAAAVLRIGTPADYAPFSVARDGRLEGSDVELMLSFAHSLGVEAVFVRSSWRSLTDDLRAGRFDLAVGGVSVTAARAALATFSAPIARSGKTAIGRCTDAARFGRLADIDAAGVTVVFNPGGTNESFARSHLHAARLAEHTDNRTIFDELDARRADVMFTDETEVALAVHHHPGLCRLLPEAYEATDKAFLLPKESDLASAVEPWLTGELKRGTPALLLERYLSR